MLKKQIFILSAVFFLSGCGLPFVAQVNSISAPAISSGKNYRLLSGKDGVTNNDLQFKEFSTYVDYVLSKQGYIRSDENADIAIFLNYGIGEPQTSYYSYSLPIYGQVGGGVSTFNASTYGSGGYSTTSGSIYTTPTYGEVGQIPINGQVTNYYRYIILEAVDFNKYKSNQIVPVWKTTINSRGRSGDLRFVFPYLLVAAEPFIGTNTKQDVNVKIYLNNEQVKKLKDLLK